jgi:hypothetical protein
VRFVFSAFLILWQINLLKIDYNGIPEKLVFPKFGVRGTGGGSHLSGRAMPFTIPKPN